MQSLKKAMERIVYLISSRILWSKYLRKFASVSKQGQTGRFVHPPPLKKQQILLEYARKYHLDTFIETGTCYGDMLEALRNDFDHIYSIELSKDLYAKAKERFKDVHHIELVQGDSGKELGNVLAKISQPALIWLDAHYSGGKMRGHITARSDTDTPVIQELSHIFNAKSRGHIIIIDDARCFGVDPAYPTINEIRSFIEARSDNLELVVQDDCIRIFPK